MSAYYYTDTLSFQDLLDNKETLKDRKVEIEKIDELNKGEKMENLKIKNDELNVQNFDELYEEVSSDFFDNKSDSEKSKDELFRLRERKISEELKTDMWNSDQWNSFLGKDKSSTEQYDSETNEENNVKPINSFRLKEIIGNGRSHYYFTTDENCILKNTKTVGHIINGLTDWLHRVEFMRRVDDLKLYICKEFDSIKHQKEDVHPYDFIELNWKHFVESDKNTSTYVVNKLKTLFNDIEGFHTNYYYEELRNRLTKIWIDSFTDEDLDNLKKENISDEVIRKTIKIRHHLNKVDVEPKDILSTNKKYLCEETEEDGRVYSYEFDRYVLESIQKLFPSEDITHWVEIITKRLVCPKYLLKKIEFKGSKNNPKDYVRPHLRPYYLVLKSILSYKSQFMS